MAGKITFKVETNGKPFGVKIWPKLPGAKKTTLDFDNPDKTDQRTLAKGDYYAYWVFFGLQTTFKLTITDAAGASVKTVTDKMPDGQKFEHDMILFSIP